MSTVRVSDTKTKLIDVALCHRFPRSIGRDKHWRRTDTYTFRTAVIGVISVYFGEQLTLGSVICVLVRWRNNAREGTLEVDELVGDRVVGLLTCHLWHHTTPNSDTNFCTFFWTEQSRAPHGSNEILSRSSGLGSFPLSSDLKFGENDCVSPPQQGFRKFAAVLKHDFSGECVLHIFPVAGISQVCCCIKARFGRRISVFFLPKLGFWKFAVVISHDFGENVCIFFHPKLGFRNFVCVIRHYLLTNICNIRPKLVFRKLAVGWCR